MTTRQRSSRTWCHMELPAATKPTNANFVRVIRTKVQSIKIVTNDSIGTCSSELYIFNLLKLPPPPRAAILVYIYYHIIINYHYILSYHFYCCYYIVFLLLLFFIIIIIILLLLL